ncbi:MAG TPA: GNAT family N-acetyltransferase [Acidobacteriota bacterium]|nr:GNAT family N-acetyltransferase [Acidobacteriota bacterium]
MKKPVYLKRPSACDERERREFARLVREGFNGSDSTLEERISAARRLAFCWTDEDAPAAISGLKAPSPGYRESLFEKARSGLSAAPYELELGWVYVVPHERGKGLGADLCRRLLQSEGTCGLFATTRPDNAPMIKILSALGFRRVGQPYPRRRERLTLFLRPPPAGAA